MAIVLENVTEDGLVALRHLCELGAYDLSELNGTEVNESGMYLTDFNCKAWHDDPNYSLFFVRVDGFIAGFVIIRYISEEDIHYLNHFFILRKFRKQHVGKQAAIMAFDLFAGRWRVSQFDWNVPAQIFWRKVLAAYTNDTYTEIRRKDNKGPAQEFINVI